MRTAMAIAGMLMLAGASHAQPPATCQDEVRVLRFLVQKYGQDRTALEFALAKTESERQRLEAELAKRDQEVK